MVIPTDECDGFHHARPLQLAPPWTKALGTSAKEALPRLGRMDTRSHRYSFDTRYVGYISAFVIGEQLATAPFVHK